MGYISNQWLKDDRKRIRSHSPIEVSVMVVAPSDDWPEGVAAAISMMRSGCDYHVLYLTKADLNSLLPSLARQTDLDIRKESALETLSDMNDSDLLRFMEELFSRRTRNNNGIT